MHEERETVTLPTISVFVVEDDRDTRQRLVEAIQDEPRLCLIGDVGTCAEAKSALTLHPVDIVLIDLELPDGNGTNLIQKFCSPDNHCAFLVLTVFAGDNYMIPALEAGAMGYLLKDTPMSDITKLIISLYEGNSPISPRIARKLLRSFRTTANNTDNESTDEQDTAQLTLREKEVLTVLSKGFNYAETADILHISYHTVVSHAKKVYKKLAVNSRMGAISKATKQGLL